MAVNMPVLALKQGVLWVNVKKETPIKLIRVSK